MKKFSPPTTIVMTWKTSNHPCSPPKTTFSTTTIQLFASIPVLDRLLLPFSRLTSPFTILFSYSIPGCTETNGVPNRLARFQSAIALAQLLQEPFNLMSLGHCNLRDDYDRGKVTHFSMYQIRHSLQKSITITNIDRKVRVAILMALWVIEWEVFSWSLKG